MTIICPKDGPCSDYDYTRTVVTKGCISFMEITCNTCGDILEHDGEEFSLDDIANLKDKQDQRAFEFAEAASGAKKHQGDKVRVELVSPEMITGIAEVLTYGVKKGYGENNWRKGLPLLTSYAAAMRHLLKWQNGIDLDDESGIHHLKHAMCNIGMMVTQIERGRDELDDRYKGE